MAQKLKDDHINLEIFLTTDQVQQSIQQLKNVIRNSEDTIRAHRNALSKLAAQGKQDTDEYKRLEKAIRDEQAAIKLNTAQLKAQTDALRLDQLSMNQLRKRAAELKRELDRLVKANDPAKWEEVNRKYQETIQYMDQLNGKVKQTGESITDIFKNKFTQFTAAGNLLATAIESIISVIGEALSAVRDFIAEGILMASVSEGVAAAFNKLNKPDLLKNLRAETKNLLTDFQLMQTAVKADNFNIPLENLGTLLKFAQQRAQETGESVDYLADSIITGLGRESPLILDNLGISAVKLQERAKATGNFMKAAISIVNEELAKQGDLALSAADRATQASVKWQNAQTKAGEKLLGISNLWHAFSGAVADWISRLIEKYLPGIVRGLEYIINELIDLYNKSTLLRVHVQLIIAQWTTGFEALRVVFSHVIDHLKLMWQLMKAITTLDFSDLRAAWDDFNKSIVENAKQSVNTVMNAWTSMPAKINRKFNKINLSASLSGNAGTSALNPDPTVDSTSGTAAQSSNDNDTQNRLREIENALTAEINLLRRKRNEGLLTEKEYSRQVEELTLESLRRKLEIKEQERSALLQLESQILDTEFKLKQAADAELLDTMKRTHERQLQMLEEKRNLQLETLQDEESDRELYALRAAEIESEHAAQRLDVIKKFGQQLAGTEFQIAENRQKAVDESNKAMIDAETALLTAKDKMQKNYLKTAAGFERQFRIKTWTQRRDEELALLQRYREQQLIDEETFQTALAAVEKKYADEQFRARREYELNNLKQRYDAEMEALTARHEQELLSEEEFEQAKLNIKLQYAGELARQQQQFAQQAADVVKALEESETASLQAEYAKREAALTQQYNQGILSAEQYNQQKEQLDYEQRVKELEVQKKYADANFAMQASQIIATGALAAIQAFSAMAAIPIVGPILGAIAAAAVAVTTALQLAKAKAERDRIKALTLESPGGGSGTVAKTGSIQLKPGLAEGGYNAPTGLADGGSNAPDIRPGGYTGDGKKYDVAGWLPVHSGEYVVDAESLKYPDVADKVRAIERVRRRHTSRNPLPEGFADGGSNTPDDPPYTEPLTLDRRMSQRLVDLLTRLADGDITVNYGITELEAQQRRKMTAESNFTLKP